MSKLQLPDVTLVCVETRELALAALALEDCLRVAEFGDVLVLTNDPAQFTADYRGELYRGRQSIRYHPVPDWPEKVGWSRAWWFDVPPLLRTRQTLNIQWDSWIWDASMWRDEFLNYDFIGAPWWYKDGKNVGNGGFSLVSTRLKRYIYDHRDKYPCDVDVDDDLLCRKYRPQLEERGFVWAPEKVAYDFSYEGCGLDAKPPTKHFGFHAAFNFGHVLGHDRLIERARLMLASPYIRESYMMRAFAERNPDIVAELLQAKELRAAE